MSDTFYAKTGLKIRSILLGQSGFGIFYLHYFTSIANSILLYLIVSLNLVHIWQLLARKTVVQIAIDSQKGQINFKLRSILGVRKEITLLISDIRYTYDFEWRSLGSQVLRIYRKDKTIVKIYNTYDGWKEKVLDKLVLVLEEANVEKVGNLAFQAR